MKKKIKICLLLIILIVPLLLSGCTHEMVSLYLYTMPSKLVYAKGEELSLKGMVLKNIKTDSALMKVWNNSANFDGFDSTKTGKQTIRVSYGKFTTSFTVYVANKVVSENDNLNEIIASADNGDVILIKEGIYNLTSPLEIKSSIVIGGEGKNKTKINGSVIIGGTIENGEIVYRDSVSNVSIYSLSLNAKSRVKNSIIEFEEDYINKSTGAINAQNIDGLNVVGCNFSGFPYGITTSTATNMNITNNIFKGLLIGGINIETNITNSLINKNIIQDIGNGVVVKNDNNEQENIFGVKLSFNQSENVGVTLFRNSISKIGLNSGEFRYFEGKSNGKYFNSTYMLKSSAIIVRSSGEDNLQTSGITIVSNSLGATLNNVLYNTNENDNVNSNSISFILS